MDTLAGNGRRVFWIGMPPMRTASYSETMKLVNGIYSSEAAKRPAVQYVDAWALFSGPGGAGTYSQSIADETGKVVSMRLDDGIHLNVAGSQRLARLVIQDVGKIVNLTPPTTTTSSAAAATPTTKAKAKK